MEMALEEKVLESLSQSTDPNPIESPWIDLKKALHKRSIYNLIALRHFCKRKIGIKMPNQYMADPYPISVSAAIQTKGSSTMFK